MLQRSDSFTYYDKLIQNVVLSVTSQPFALSTLDDIKNTPQLVKLSTNHHQKINRMMSDQDKAFRKEYSQIRGIKTYKIMPKSLQPKQKQMETLNDIDDEAKQQLKTHMKIAFDQLYLAKVSEIKHYKKQLYHLVESKIKDEKARLKHIASREMEELSKRNEERRVEKRRSYHRLLTNLLHNLTKERFTKNTKRSVTVSTDCYMKNKLPELVIWHRAINGCLKISTQK